MDDLGRCGVGRAVIHNACRIDGVAVVFAHCGCIRRDDRHFRCDRMIAAVALERCGDLVVRRPGAPGGRAGVGMRGDAVLCVAVCALVPVIIIVVLRNGKLVCAGRFNLLGVGRAAARCLAGIRFHTCGGAAGFRCDRAAVPVVRHSAAVGAAAVDAQEGVRAVCAVAVASDSAGEVVATHGVHSAVAFAAGGAGCRSNASCRAAGAAFHADIDLKRTADLVFKNADR